MFCPLFPVLFVSNKLYRYCADLLFTFWQIYPTVSSCLFFCFSIEIVFSRARMRATGFARAALQDGGADFWRCYRSGRNIAGRNEPSHQNRLEFSLAGRLPCDGGRGTLQTPDQVHSERHHQAHSRSRYVGSRRKNENVIN